MDIRSDFTKSFNLLMHHKRIIIPAIISVIIPLILIATFLNISGFTPLIKEFYALQKDFDNQKTSYLLNAQNMNDSAYVGELSTYLSKESDDSPYQTEFWKYAESEGFGMSGFESKFMELITPKNLLLLIIFILIGIIAELYFTSMAYSIITLSIQEKDLRPGSVLDVTNHFFLKLLSVRLLFIPIIVIPLLVLLVFGVLFFFLNMFLGIFAALIFILLFIVYAIYVGVRLVFVIPMLYIEQEGAIDSMKHSWKITHAHIWRVVVLFFIIYGINVVMNNVLTQPLHSTYMNALLGNETFRIIINIVLVALFVLLEGIIISIQNLFLFYSYIDYKEFDAVETEKSNKTEKKEQK